MIDESYNFRRINDSLTTSGVVSADQLAELSREGYSAVINLLPGDSEHAVTDEARIVEDQGLAYVHIPVDFAAPTHADFEAFATAMDEHGGDRLHVHCAANFRVSAFYGLYAVRRGICTTSEADELVQDLWDPTEYPAWATFISEERASRPS
jgi:uncharacterized protein (TIGR01244 family)